MTTPRAKTILIVGGVAGLMALLSAAGCALTIWSLAERDAQLDLSRPGEPTAGRNDAETLTGILRARTLFDYNIGGRKRGGTITGGTEITLAGDYAIAPEAERYPGDLGERLNELSLFGKRHTRCELTGEARNGRRLAECWVRGEHLGEALRRSCYVRRLGPDPAEPPDWCAGYDGPGAGQQ